MAVRINPLKDYISLEENGRHLLISRAFLEFDRSVNKKVFKQ